MRIRVSEKHGVNPSLAVCYVCGEDTGEIVLLGRIAGDEQAPRKAVFNNVPCPKCREYMKQGIILIGIRGLILRGQEPNRSGHFVVVSEDWVTRCVNTPSLRDEILQKRISFVQEELVAHLLSENEKLQQGGT